MDIVSLIIAVALVGFLVWVIMQIPMPAPFQRIIVGVACVGLVLYVLQAFGVWHGFNGVRIR